MIFLSAPASLLRLAAVAVAMAASAALAADRPNIIYILTDDLGYGDLGCYGQKTLTTPNIDRLAAEGVKFTRHYAGDTVCAPSRCVLMTGLHTGHCRVRGNDPWTIPDTDVTVPNLLKKAGYATACFGKYGLGKPLPDDDPNRKGFDTFFGYVDTSHAHNFYPTYLVRNGKREPLPNITAPGSRKSGHEDTGFATAEGRKQWAPQVIGDELQKYLQARAGEKQPFFVYYALNMPHANNEAGKDSPQKHGMEVPSYGEFEKKDWPDVEKGFASAMRFIDDQVGGVVATLKKLGLDENTMVMFASDNGPHAEGLHSSDFFDSNGGFNGIKRSMTDGGIRVPFIARWPSAIKPGVVSEHVSGFQDLLPTVAELAGTKVEGETDGISFVPTLKGNGGPQVEHKYLFWDFNEQGGKKAVLKWPWKLIHLNTGGRQKKNAAAQQGGVPKSLQVQLFNLEEDPAEQNNLATLKPELVTELEGYMKEAWREPVRE
ncbi:MAG: arylsulfatase [Verrucomicrobium sp.]